jgi:hypothetical protein
VHPGPITPTLRGYVWLAEAWCVLAERYAHMRCRHLVRPVKWLVPLQISSYCPCRYLVSTMLWLLFELTVPCAPSAAIIIEESSWFRRCTCSVLHLVFLCVFFLSPGRHARAWAPHLPYPSAAVATSCLLPMRHGCVNAMPACFQCVDSRCAHMLRLGFFRVGCWVFPLSYTVVHNVVCSCRSMGRCLTP